MERKQRKKIIKEIKIRGLLIRQIERLTKVSFAFATKFLTKNSKNKFCNCQLTRNQVCLVATQPALMLL